MGALCLCFIAAAAVWLQTASPPGSGPAPSAAYTPAGGEMLREGEQITVTGRVYQRETRTSYGQKKQIIYLNPISIHQFRSSGQEEDNTLTYNLICELEQPEAAPIGAMLQVSGRFACFSRASNPGEFDAWQYYHTLGIGGSLKEARIVASDQASFPLREGLARLREYWKRRLYLSLPEKEASLLCTMLLGDKTELDREIKELYRRNGIVHLLSISGLHVTIIGMGWYRLLRRLGCHVWAAAGAGAALLLLYGCMTGMGVSSRRAIGMYLIRMIGECLGRSYDMLTALGVMAVVMVAGRLEYLSSSGFLLSYGSVCGIGLLLPALAGVRREADAGAGEGKGIRRLYLRLGQSVLAGLSISFFTLPVHLSFFYEVPVYAIFLNLLVLPFMGVVMMAGLLVMIVPGLQFLRFPVCWIFTGYEALCGIFDRLPFHTWRPGCPEGWQVILFYGLAVLLILFGSSWKRRWKYSLMAVAVILLGLRFHFGMEVTVLDVGQGDCILVRTDGGEIYLFDGGSSTESRMGQYTLLPYLKYEGIRTIDAIFVSHPDLDHISGILELLGMEERDSVTVRRMILPGIEEGRRQEELGELLAAADRAYGGKGVKTYYLTEGREWSSGAARFICLHPYDGYQSTDSNSYSMCIYLEYGAFSMLLTGDVEGAGEAALTDSINRRQLKDITVLKAAHHGSRNSTPEELLALLKPSVAVISCGEDNSYGHPHRETLERLEAQGVKVLQTPQTGAIKISVNKNKMKLSLFYSRSEHGQADPNRVK